MVKMTLRISLIVMLAGLGGLVLPGEQAWGQRTYINPANFRNHCNVSDTLWIWIDDQLAGIEGASFSLAFDQSIANVDTVIAEPFLAGNMFLAFRRYSPDSLNVDLGILSGSVSGPTPLFGVVVTLTDNLGLTTLVQTRSILRNANNQDIVHLSAAGGIDNPCCCQYHGIMVDDGVFNALDIVALIDYIFRNAGAPPTDPGCPHINRSDVNCDGVPNVLDIVRMIDFVFGGVPLCEPCDAVIP